MKNGILKKLNFAFGLGSLALVVGCADKKISEKHDRDTSHNYLTGSDTVTDTTEAKYQNRKTGKVTNTETSTETKYDDDGKEVSRTKKVIKK